MMEFETQLGIEFNSISGLKEFKKMVLNKQSKGYFPLQVISSVIKTGFKYFQIGTRNAGLTCLFVSSLGGEVVFTESNPKGYESVIDNLNKNPDLKKNIYSYKTCIFGSKRVMKKKSKKKKIFSLKIIFFYTKKNSKKKNQRKKKKELIFLFFFIVPVQKNLICIILTEIKTRFILHIGGKMVMKKILSLIAGLSKNSLSTLAIFTPTWFV